MVNGDLFAGESRNIEYKLEIPGKSARYMKTVVAFANGKGGQIVFGVRDKTCEVIGIDEDNVFQKMDAIANAISDSCEPKIIPDITLQTIGDKTVIIVEIDSGRQKPYYLKSLGIVKGTYIRVSGTTRLAENYMLKELILEGQNLYYDQEPCEDLTISEDEIDKLCKELKATALQNSLTDEEKAQVKDVTENVLLSWGILAERDNVIVPTNAYSLLTGKAKFPPVIQCGIFKGIDRAVFVDRREFTGTIQRQFEEAYRYVLGKINLGAKIEGMYRQDIYELPIGSVRELIANAVAHRSYLDPGNIQVALYDDRLEITSPGMLLSGVSIEKMKEGFSKIRNRAIASAFSYMRIIERWGSGIPRVIRECREYGLRELEMVDLDGDFRVNMYRNTDNSTQATQSTTQATILISLTNEDKSVLKLLCDDPSITQKQIASKLAWKVNRVKYYLNKLKKKQIIARVGNNQRGHWELLIDKRLK